MSGFGPTCEGNCRYRQMYEGSQQSLSDMAARQAQAVDRLGRLRSSVAVALKRRFPRLVLDAESALGSRLSEVEDEVLVAQMDALLMSTRSSGIADLRGALEAAGFVLPEDDDLSLWAGSVAGQVEAFAARRGVSPSGVVDSSGSDDLTQLFASQDGDELAGLFGLSSGGEAPASDGATPASGGRPGGEEVAEGKRASSGGGGSEVPAVRVGSVPGAGARADAGSSDPLRPEVPRKRGSRGSKKPRSGKATAPAVPLPLDVPADAGRGADAKSAASEDVSDDGEMSWVTADILKAMMAGVCIPRPVFASDLAGVAGSMERVAEWERMCRKRNLPVRTVPAKMRHARRGSLIFPVGDAREMAGEFGRSVWGDVLDSKERAYRGGKLYELAVLLHRTAEQVVSHRLDPNTVTLRLSQPGGLAGVVVLLGGSVDDESVRDELVASVGELVKERLSSVAVLAASGSEADFERMVSAVADAAAAEGWRPTMPVVAGYSWDYADTRGANAKVVLGA